MGDLDSQLKAWDKAKQAYAGALPLYREIGARLGEASCLRSMALLRLQTGEPRRAFEAFLETRSLQEKIGDNLGLQGTLGYLARTAAAMGAIDQALFLAECSLDLGRQIGDRFGQIINLELQIELLIKQEQFPAATAGACLHRDLAVAIGDSAWAQTFATLIDGVKKKLPEQAWLELVDQAEGHRAGAIAEATKRLQERGIDPLQPPISEATDPE